MMIETNRGELGRIRKNVGINGSIYYEFDTFTKTWDNFWTCVGILRQFEAHRVE